MSNDPQNSIQQRRYLVCGRVQRVGFRYATYRKANALGLSGYVRNLPDGRVEICAGGHDEGLAQLSSWLHVGPLLARVDEVMELPWDEVLESGFTMSE
jgi:acylphosphatase